MLWYIIYLKNNLTIISQLLEQYFLATEGQGWRKQKLKEIWEVDRAPEVGKKGKRVFSLSF